MVETKISHQLLTCETKQFVCFPKHNGGNVFLKLIWTFIPKGRTREGESKRSKQAQTQYAKRIRFESWLAKALWLDALPPGLLGW